MAGWGDTSRQPARPGPGLPPWPGPGFGLAAAWRGTGGRRAPWLYRAHRPDLRVRRPEYGGGNGQARSLDLADVALIAREGGGAGGAGTAAVYDTDDLP